MRPGRTVCRLIFAKRRWQFRARRKQRQVRVVVQREDDIAGEKQRRILTLSSVSRPKRLPGGRIEAELLTFIAM